MCCSMYVVYTCNKDIHTCVYCIYTNMCLLYIRYIILAFMHKMCTHIHRYICPTNPCLKCKILMKLHPGKLTAGTQKPPQNLLPSTSMTVPAVNFPGQKHGDCTYPGSQITIFIPCRVSTKKERPYFLHGG